MTDEMAAFKKAIEEAGEEAAPSRSEPVPLRPTAQPPRTLVEQMQRLESAERQLDGQLRREMTEARIVAERKVNEAQAHFLRMLGEETARLERERDEMIRQAGNEYHKTMHDLEVLERRRRAVEH